MFCPVCGVPSPARALTCSACHAPLDLFAGTASDLDSPRCPGCGGVTPAPLADRAAYCMRCGKPLRAALAILPATPDLDLCPLCQCKGVPVKTLSDKSTPDLPRGLGPPRSPLALRWFGAAGQPTIDSSPRAAARRKRAVLPFLGSATSRGYTFVIWALGALGLALLLLAVNKVGSFRDLPSTILQSDGLGSVISGRVAASLPLLLGALAALAAAVILLAIKEIIGKLWHHPVLAYQRALKNWDAACYCPKDRIVFIRTLTSVHWDPVEELPRLIARDWNAGHDLRDSQPSRG